MFLLTLKAHGVRMEMIEPVDLIKVLAEARMMTRMSCQSGGDPEREDRDGVYKGEDEGEGSGCDVSTLYRSLLGTGGCWKG